MDLQLIRRAIKSMHKAGNQAIANDVVAWEAQFRCRIQEVEVYLGSIGAVSGSTTVDIKLNGVSILTAAISIAFNAATKRTRVGISGLTPVFGGPPEGVRIQPGDYLRVDVTAIPGTTSADLTVTLSLVLEDV